MHAHARGVLHRDLKPHNVVRDSAGHPKILDFGISSRVPEAIAHEVTRTGTTAISPSLEGSLPYMAPEILRGATADERTDLWSFGVLGYELLTGERPFKGADTLTLVASILEARVHPLPSTIPEPLARVVTRLLAKDPGERYASAREVAAALDTATPTVTHRGSRAPVLAITVAALALLGGYLGWRLLDAKPLTLSDQHLVSGADGPHRAPSFSPDGTMLAVVVPDAAGIPQVRVVNLAQGTSLPITSGGAATSRPRWSPKGDQIFYVIEAQGIWSVSPLGGEPRRVLETGFNPNLSRDGARLVFEDRSGLWTAAVDGTDVQKVTGTLPVPYPLPRGPAFSPDGTQIVFFQTEVGPNGDLWIIDSSGGTPRRLTSDLCEGGWPVWTADGRAIIYSSARGGSRTLWQVPSAGGVPVALTVGAGEDDQPDLAADGRRFTYTNVRNTWDLRVRDLAAASERSILRRGIEMQFPIFSPDGTRIVFFGRADYAVAVFTINVDGSGLRQLTGARELNHQPRWGPDGKDAYFFQIRPEQSFRRIPALGGASVNFRPWEWTSINTPQFDPTGRFIAYLKMRPRDAPATTPENTVIHDIATGENREWAEPHTYPAGWSQDGQSVVGWQHDGSVVICEVAGARCRSVAKGASPVWPPGSGRVYFARPQNPAAAQELWSVALDGSDERREAAMGTFRPIDRFFAVSKDGLAAWAGFQPGRHEVWTATVK